MVSAGSSLAMFVPRDAQRNYGWFLLGALPYMCASVVMAATELSAML